MYIIFLYALYLPHNREFLSTTHLNTVGKPKEQLGARAESTTDRLRRPVHRLDDTTDTRVELACCGGCLFLVLLLLMDLNVYCHAVRGITGSSVVHFSFCYSEWTLGKELAENLWGGCEIMIVCI